MPMSSSSTKMRAQDLGSPGNSRRFSKRRRPCRHRLSNLAKYILFRLPTALQDIERMIGGIDDVKRCKLAERCYDFLHHLEIRETVACALDEKHWHLHLREM